MRDRFDKLIKILDKFSLTGLALNPGPTLTYLTGLHFHLMERPTVLLITKTGESAMILPELEKGKLKNVSVPIRAFTYQDDPTTWSGTFGQAVGWLKLTTGMMGVEATRMRFLELKYLEDNLPGMQLIDASQAIAALRIIKEAGEIEKMKQAALIAQKALLETLRTIRQGMTEREISNELIIQLLRSGSDPELPFPPIVAIGENSANPHAVPTDRALQPGDILLIDWGASYEGYLSDITRTFTFGEVDPEMLEVGKIVLAANQAGRDAGSPGEEAGTVDRAARAVISDAGYGEAFIHRTGHGLGMEAHEFPYIYAENEMILAAGMTFTIEPGIYLPCKGGVRIEDDVVMTESGLVSLTDLPREVLPLENFMS